MKETKSTSWIVVFKPLRFQCLISPFSWTNYRTSYNIDSCRSGASNFCEVHALH